MKKTCSRIQWLTLLTSAVFLLSPLPVMAGMGMGWGGLPSSPTDPNEVEQVITPGPMKSPMRIAVQASGKFLVTDYQGKKVYQISAENLEAPIELIKLKGHPLAVENVGRFLFVGNDDDRSIELYRFRRDRKNNRRYAGKTIATDVQPSDFAYDRRKRLVFVADSLNHEVKVFKNYGRYVGAFGSSAPLSDPKGIAVDRLRQQIFVSDYGDPAVGISASVNVFDYKGRLLKRFTGNFGRPQGIAVDDNNIYFVDALLGQVLIYDRNTYASVGSIGSFGSAEGSLLLPMDLVLDSNVGKLYVTNNRMGRIASFALPGQ